MDDCRGEAKVAEPERKDGDIPESRMPDPRAWTGVASVESCIIDGALRVAAMTERLGRWTGSTATDSVGRSLKELPGPLWAAVHGVLQRATTSLWPGEDVRVLDGDRVLCATCRPLLGGEGPTGFSVVVRDVTDALTTSLHLRMATERLSALMRLSEDAVLMVDSGGRILTANRPAERLAGFSEADLLGRAAGDVFRFLDEQTKESAGDPIVRGLESADPPETPPRFILPTLEQGDVAVLLAVAAIRNPNGAVTGGVVVIRPVPASTEKDAESWREQKRQSLQLLAGGLAHDFNNILTGILGNASLAAMMVPWADPVRERLEEVCQVVEQARELTYLLFTFSRTTKPVCTRTNLREVVREAAVFALRGARASCRFTIAEDLWPVDVDPAQIRMAFVNVLVNADQAMPEGGEIVVDVRNRALRTAEIRELTPGRYVVVSIRDSGAGIPPEQLQRVFDPYFSTRPGRSGLGLTTSESIVRAHGGRITIRSRPGSGTTVSIYLPAASQEPGAFVLETARVKKGRFLVMDDDPSIRTVARRILDHLGFECVEVEDGEAAMTAYMSARDAGQPFDAVIADLTVPGGVGAEALARRILEQDPSAKLLVSSGYVTDPILTHPQAHGFKGVVKKPYSLDEMRKALKEAEVI